MLSLGASERADERLTIGDRPGRDELARAARDVRCGNLAGIAVACIQLRIQANGHKQSAAAR